MSTNTPQPENESHQQIQPNDPVQPAPATPQPHPENSPGVIILQWLTYAFWGWTVLLLGTLVAAVFSYYIDKAESGLFSIYALSATLVLLPIALVCDFFYSKKEPLQKKGAAMVVMVIHAVLFAFFAISSIIAIVFSVIQMLTTTGDAKVFQITLFSAIITSVVYFATFIRTLRPQKMLWINKAYAIFMAVVIGVVLVIAIAGPIMGEQRTKNDKLVEQNLDTVVSSINDYARDNDELPESLNDLKLRSTAAEQLANKNLIQYKPNTKPPTTTNASTRTTTTKQTTYYYELCADYTEASDDDKYTASSYNKSEDGYYTSVYNLTRNHPAGNVCYKLKTTDYGRY